MESFLVFVFLFIQIHLNNFRHALFSLSSVRDDLHVQALDWLGMFWFRAIHLAQSSYALHTQK